MSDGPGWIRHASGGATVGGIIGGAVGFVAAPFIGIDPITGAVAGSSAGGIAGGQISAWRDRRRALQSLLALARQAEEDNKNAANKAFKNLYNIAVKTDMGTDTIITERHILLKKHKML